MLTSLRHNLTSLTRFSGRDRRGLFWPYAANVLALGFVSLGVTTSTIMTMIFTGPTQPGQDDGALLAPFFWAMGLWALAMVALLAAAVARRLHDRGRSALWGLPAPVFLTIGLILFPILFGQAMSGAEMTASIMVLFLALFANNVAYLASLVLLLVLLVKDSDAGANRYGPAAQS